MIQLSRMVVVRVVGEGQPDGLPGVRELLVAPPGGMGTQEDGGVTGVVPHDAVGVDTARGGAIQQHLQNWNNKRK